MEILYFSGSGNSLHLAKELYKKVPGAKLIPIVSLLKEKHPKTNSEVVGFVFPNHGMTIPIPVRKLLHKLDLSSAEYMFSVVTRGGTRCFADVTIDKLLSKSGKQLDAYYMINMASNDPKLKHYEVPSDEKLREIDASLAKQLKDIVDCINLRQKHRVADTTLLYPSGFLLNKLVLLGMRFAEKDGAKDYFYCDSKCTGCGVCDMVCPSGKISMNGRTPVWSNATKCYLCYACLNYCPSKAVQIKDKLYMKSYTKDNGRYPHPYATAKEIAEQKL